MAAAGEVSWPPAGTFVAAYGENVMAADNLDSQLPSVRAREALELSFS